MFEKKKKTNTTEKSSAMKQSKIKQTEFNLFGVKKRISQYFPIIDIDNGVVELDMGDKITMYKKNSNNDYGAYTEKEIELISKGFSKYFETLKDDSSINMAIHLDNKKENFEKMFNTKSGNEGVDLYKKSKQKEFEKTKFIDVYYGFDSFSHSKRTQGLMKKFKAKPMNTDEVVSYIYDKLNPDHRTNDGSIIFKPTQFKNDYHAGNSEFINLLYQSFFEENEGGFYVGEHKVKVYNLVELSDNMNINDLISDLSSLKSNVLINVQAIKNDAKMSSFKRKATISGSSFMTAVYQKNKYVSYNIKKMISYIEKRHNSLMLVNLSIILINNNEKELEDDFIDLNKWNGAVVTLNRYNSLFEYSKAIPGMIRKSNFNYYLPSDYASKLFIPKSYMNEPTTSIFRSQDNLMTPFSFKSSHRKINSNAIIAPTGSGKSVLANYILNTRFIEADAGNNLLGLLIDLGGSYNNLVKYYNQYLPEDKKIVYKHLNTKEYYNVCDMDFGKKFTNEDVEEKIRLLLKFLRVALETENHPISQEEEVVLLKGIRSMYRMAFIEDKFLTDDQNDTFFDIYVKSDYSDKEAFIKAMPTLSDLVTMIQTDVNIINSSSASVRSDITGKIQVFLSTEAGALFSNKSTEIITGRIVIIDFNDFLTGEDSGKLPVLFLQFFINNRYQYFIRKDFEYLEKIILVDEYPQFLKIQPGIEKTVDFLLKTGRKKGIDTTIIVQNPGTIHRDFFPNLGTIIAFNLNLPSQIRDLEAKLGMENEGYLDIMENLEYVDKVYSDFIVIEVTGLHKAIFRLQLSDFDKDLMTIQPDVSKSVLKNEDDFEALADNVENVIEEDFENDSDDNDWDFDEED